MNRRKTAIGVFLILLGVVTALGNLDMVKDLVVLPIISTIFLFLYFYLGAWKKRGNLGFLIPGVIVGVVGIYSILEEGNLIPNGMDSIFLVFLGMGFLLIMFIHTMRIENGTWGEKYWPVFPGGILMLVGAVALATEENNTAASLITPSIMILIGVYILIKPMLKPRYKNNDKDKI